MSCRSTTKALLDDSPGALMLTHDKPEKKSFSTDQPPKLISESSFSKISVADSSNHHDCEQIVVKTLNNENPKACEIKIFYNEYEILQNVSHPGIRRVIGKTKFEGRHTLYLEWVHGKTIRESGKMNTQDFLFIAQQITEAFVELHAHRIVHKNVSPENILVNPDTRQMKIIDFKFSSKIGVKEHHLNHFYQNANCISPEQGGMIDHIIDHRADLYSLGCVFYYMLAGELPFECHDQSRLLEMHATHYPTPLCCVDQFIPASLSDLVEKLMKKTPDERYQSAIGLLYDLRLISSHFQSGRIAFNFSPAQKDNLDQFRFSEKLYGRTKQIETLSSAFGHVREGGKKMVLIAGSSGTGKSSLMEHLCKSVVKNNGLFIQGKYDQLQKSEPYSAILQAIKHWCELVMKENGETRDRFRSIIQKAVGSEGKILTDVVSELELIIGSQSHVPEVGAIETQNRFNYIFRQFVKAISTAHHPIILFVDDLQWADSASLDLLSVLMADKEIKYLLFVGAYRENEVGESHLLATKLLHERENDAVTLKIKIGNLGRKYVDELISDVLDTPQEEIYALTNLVHEKTEGNPFFVVEFLKSLLDEKVLYMSYHEFKWKWIAEKIKEKDVTKNVIDVIAQKFRKLPKKTRNALKIASCLGSRFDLSILQLIMGEEEANEFLDEVLLKDFIKQSTIENTKFHFSHDRMQQVVHETIRESERNIVHLHIGRILQKKLSQKQLDEMLFLVVNQLNAGVKSISDKHEKSHLAKLNQEASEKARLSSAFELAAGFSSIGIELLDSNSWKENYDLCLKLHVTASEMAYFKGNYDLMDEMVEQGCVNATSILDKVQLHVIKIKSLRARNKLEEALEAGLHVLDQLGESFSSQISMLSLMLDLSKTKLMLWSKGNDVIASMSEMKDERAIAAMTIMAEISPSARMANQKLMALLTLRMVQLTMKYGITKFSILGFTWYGIITCAQLGDYEEGYRMGQLLLMLLERFPDKQSQCWIKFSVNSGITLYKENICLTLKPLQDVIRLWQESGDIEFSLYGVWRYCAHVFLVGGHLLEVEEKMKNYCRLAEAHKQQYILDIIPAYWQAVLNLLGSGSDDPTRLRGEAFDEEAMRQCNLSKNVFANVAVNFNCMFLAYFFHRYEEAAQYAEECEQIMKPLNLYEKQNLEFYSGLISLAMAKKDKKNSRWIKIASSKVRKMRKLASFYQDNFLNKLHLLEAEMAAVRGCQQKAMEHFKNAIDVAKSRNFTHEEALACERAGIFYAETDREHLAYHFLSRACKVYHKWGAEAKVSQLQKLHEKLFQTFQKQNKSEQHSALFIVRKQNDSDVKSIKHMKRIPFQMGNHWRNTEHFFGKRPGMEMNKEESTTD